MTLRIQCPHCGKGYSNISQAMLGKSARCKHCNEVFVIEASPADVVPTADQIVAVCPQCGRRYNPVPSRYIGQTTQCKDCGTRFKVQADGVTGLGGTEWEVGDVVLNLYEVKELLGVGGMGKVHRVHHPVWQMDLAVKSLRTELLRNRGKIDDFIREAETWVGLGLYPQIVACFFIQSIAGIPRVFVECVDGGSLRDWIRQRKLYAGGPDQALKRILDIAIQFAWGLDYAHELGVVHQDVKPANVLMTSKGQAKVTDFGLANAIQPIIAAGDSADSGEKTRIAMAMFAGMTPAYCSPEQAELHSKHKDQIDLGTMPKLDRRTDIWSWAVSVLEMFTGDVTWAMGNVAHEALAMFLEEGATEPALPSMPVPVGEILRDCLQPHPVGRPRDLRRVAQALVDCYASVTGERYLRQCPKPSEYQADGLNNRAVSMWELGRKSDALDTFEQALKLDQTHPFAVFNHAVLQWRTGRLDDLDVVRRIKQCGNNPSNDRRLLAELLAYVHAERGDGQAARAELNDIPGRYETLFPGEPWPQVSCVHSFDRLWATDLALSQHGEVAVAASGTQLIPLALRQPERQPALSEQGPTIERVALSGDGGVALAVNQEDSLDVWDVHKSITSQQFRGRMRDVRSVTLSRDGAFVAIVSGDGLLSTWDVGSGANIAQLTAHDSPATGVGLTGDGQSAVSAGDDRLIKVWDLRNQSCRVTLSGHSAAIYAVFIADDGGTVVSASQDRTVRAWDTTSGQCRIQLALGKDDCVAVSADGKTLVTGSGDMLTKETVLKVWDLPSGRCRRTLHGHDGAIRCVAISADGQVVVSGGWDQTVKVWATPMTKPSLLQIAKPKGGDALDQERGQAEEMLALARKDLAIHHYREAYDTLWKLWEQLGFIDHPPLVQIERELRNHGRAKALHMVYETKRIEGQGGPIRAVVFTSDTRTAIAGGDDRLVKRWELDSGQCLQTWAGHRDGITAIALLPGGQRFASASRDQTIKIWDLDALEPRLTLAGHGDIVTSLAVTSDGRTLISGSADRTIKCWDLGDGTLVQTLTGHDRPVTTLALAPDEELLVSGSQDSTVRLWDIESGSGIATIEAHFVTVSSVCITPDGRQIISGSEDQSIKLWDLTSQAHQLTLTGHRDRITGLRTSRDGKTCWSASADGSVRVWDLGSGELLKMLEGHTGSVNALGISEDSAFAMSGDDARLVLWRVIFLLDIPQEVDWDDGVWPYLDQFVKRQERKASAGAKSLAKSFKKLFKTQGPAWDEEAFQALLVELRQRGLGWVRARGIKTKLEAMLGGTKRK